MRFLTWTAPLGLDTRKGFEICGDFVVALTGLDELANEQDNEDIAVESKKMDRNGEAGAKISVGCKENFSFQKVQRSRSVSGPRVVVSLQLEYLRRF